MDSFPEEKTSNTCIKKKNITEKLLINLHCKGKQSKSATVCKMLVGIFGLNFNCKEWNADLLYMKYSWKWKAYFQINHRPLSLIKKQSPSINQ